MVKCPKCGEKNEADSEFCITCGARLKKGKDIVTLIPPSGVPKERPNLKPVPGVKIVTPTRVAPQFGGPTSITRVPSPGMCFYHKELPASYICSRCGRPICRDCAKVYSQLFFCPQCYAASIPPY